MKIEQYKEEVKRTLVVLPTLKENLIHMSYGISTEIGELLDVYKKKLAYGKEIDIVNVKEELGDILWYIFNGFNFTNTLTEKIINEVENKSNEYIEKIKNEFSLEDLLLELTGSNYSINNCILQYSSNEETSNEFGLILVNVISIINKLEFDFKEIMEMNINKLKIRFPDKFSQDNALNRNLEEERKSLES